MRGWCIPRTGASSGRARACTSLLVLAACAAWLAWAGSARATFAGRDGQLAGAGATLAGGPVIWGVDPDGSDDHALVPVARFGFADLAYSPSGGRLLYSGFDRDSQLALFSAGWNDGRARRLPRGWGASWAPDGRHLVVVGVDPVTGRNELFVLRVDGTGLHQISHLPPTIGIGGVPEWSPAGDRIAFVGAVPGSQDDIFTVRPDGSHVRRLTVTPRTVDYGLLKTGLDWAPDGRTLVFAEQYLKPSGDLASRIVEIDADGRNRRRVATGIDPIFSPDGRKLFFIDKHGGFELLDRRTGAVSPMPLLPFPRLGSFAPTTWQALPGHGRSALALRILHVPRRRPDGGITVDGAILPRQRPGAGGHEELFASVLRLQGGRWVLASLHHLVSDRDGRFHHWLAGFMRGTCLLRIGFAGSPDLLPSRAHRIFDCSGAQRSRRAKASSARPTTTTR